MTSTTSTSGCDLAPGCELFQAFPSLPEKFVVDFANGIAVTRDHLRVQNERTGMGQRLWDGLTGKAHRRQAGINASLADGVDGALRWLTELSGAVAHSNTALSRVQARVQALQDNLAQLAHYSADTRDLLSQLDQRLSTQTEALGREVARLSIEQRAERHLSQVFDKWAAGTLRMLPPLARLSASLEDLYWGDFGSLCQARHDPVLCASLLRQLAHKAIIQLNKDVTDTNGRLGERLDTQYWLAPPETVPGPVPTHDALDALQYLGDWAKPDTHPFSHCVTQRPGTLPLQVPRLMAAERAAHALVKERFVEACHV